MYREELRKRMVREGKAVLRAAQALPPEVEEAVALIASAKGRVIITGVGKSGLIGKKIASSLSSLGIPSLFVHSAEALHGDLGMITNEDVVVAISNSGETPEILAMLPSLQRIGAKVVALVGTGDSELARRADARIVYGRQEEIDSLGLAPTTSALVALALGDALAATLSEERGFTAERFHLFHPGGSLGARLSRREQEER